MTHKSADRLEETYPQLLWCIPLLAATFVAIALFGRQIEALEDRSNQLFEVQESALDHERKERNIAQIQVNKLQAELDELTEFNVRLQASIAYFGQKYNEIRRENENLRKQLGEPVQEGIDQEETTLLQSEERLRMYQQQMAAMAIWQHNQKYPLPPGYVWVYIQDPALADNNNSPIPNREHITPLGVPGASVRR
jgi:septal ring factor EnvC (AmiA/AmiB activator)